MTDIFSKEKRSKRSWLMSRVLPKGIVPPKPLYRNIAAEKTKRLASRSFALWKAGFCFIKARIAVFIDGCFWPRLSFTREIPATRSLAKEN